LAEYNRETDVAWEFVDTYDTLAQSLKLKPLATHTSEQIEILVNCVGNLVAMLVTEHTRPTATPRPVMVVALTRAKQNRIRDPHYLTAAILDNSIRALNALPSDQPPTAAQVEAAIAAARARAKQCIYAGLCS
jgi:hypothetical protein